MARWVSCTVFAFFFLFFCFFFPFFLKLESILQFCLPIFVKYYLYLILKKKKLLLNLLLLTQIEQKPCDYKTTDTKLSAEKSIHVQWITTHWVNQSLINFKLTVVKKDPKSFTFRSSRYIYKTWTCICNCTY